MFLDPLGRFDKKNLISLLPVSNRQGDRAEQMASWDELRSLGRRKCGSRQPRKRRISVLATDTRARIVLALHHVPTLSGHRAVSRQ